MDPMPTSRPRPPLGGVDPDAPLPDDVPDPRHPGHPGSPTRPGPPSRPGTPDLVLVAAGREDRWRHVVDVPLGELGDPEGLRARCGAAVSGVVPGLGPASADCPVCGAATASG